MFAIIGFNSLIIFVNQFGYVVHEIYEIFIIKNKRNVANIR